MEIELDTSGVQRRVSALLENVEQFGSVHIPEGLLAWQRNDMHRKFPNIEMPDQQSAQTRIWPTSRVLLKKRAGQAAKRVHAVSRPILRPVLVEQLCERMRALMVDKITWL